MLMCGVVNKGVSYLLVSLRGYTPRARVRFPVPVQSWQASMAA